MIRARLTLVSIGALLCALVLGDISTTPAPDATQRTDELALVGGGCKSFSAADALKGRGPGNPRYCRPAGIDAGVIHAPVPKAGKRDRGNYRPHAKGRRRHSGTDFSAPCGTTVRAAHQGKAVVIKRKRGPSTVAVTTGPGRLTTWYGPLARVRVRTGKVIDGGRALGSVAKSRTHRRCALHFVVKLRTGAADPMAVAPGAWLRKHHGQHVSGLAPTERRRGGFTVATLNVLGHTHTARRGDKRRQFAGSEQRMRHAVRLLDSNRVSLVGLQELQPPQRSDFLRMTRNWRIHSPNGDPQDSIAWRSSRFRLVKASSFRIPYFRNLRKMPVVVLKDRATGRRLVVISVHNPADRGRGSSMRKRRAEAVRREVRMVKQMRRSTGAPVILMGDFNDRGRRFFCHMTRQGLKASSGGTSGRRGCRPSQVAGIDWIFATKGVRFAGHQKMVGGLVSRTTDHPLVVARARR